MSVPLELLAPAGNTQIGIAAIDHGADAVYIGAPKFSARAAAGNSLTAIETLVKHAHLFNAKVYVALNTILTDDEIPVAEKLIRQIYSTGADGLIIQDTGLLELHLPPLPLIASTQMHITTPEKVKFLEDVGFQRVILARELSLKEISVIRSQTQVELECFVYGALCVSYSGQCYISQAITGRSGNRGVCAQLCRLPYKLKDGDHKTIRNNKHLLSLKDLNLIDALPELIGAGVTSFKIEGRYKNEAYVKNVTAAFRHALDRFIRSHNGYCSSSSGKSSFMFTPDLRRTFHRGHTTYFLSGRKKKIGSIDTPKFVGEFIGTISSLQAGSFQIKGSKAPICNGDGLCYFSEGKGLTGFNVNRVENEGIFPNAMTGLTVGIRLFRNSDHAFNNMLKKRSAIRHIDVEMRFIQDHKSISLQVTDEDNLTVTVSLDTPFEAARKPERMRDTIQSQLISTGNTIYHVTRLSIRPQRPGFLPLSMLNRLRRDALNQLSEERLKQYIRKDVKYVSNAVLYPEKKLNFRANVLNKYAKRFYTRHGATVAPAFETLNDCTGKIVMTTRYCIRHQLDACPRYSRCPIELKEPLCLTDGQHKYTLAFDCKSCQMFIHLKKI